ncbi:MAG: signal peptidase I [Bacilli bacterium]|nr:signal peptidase I [Bacilli bacterium]
MDFREIKEFFRDFLGYIIILVVIIILFVFIISVQPVAGNSMHPTLKEGDLVVVSKLLYNLGSPKRNDIVNVKDDLGKSYVKRIIGLPGERIEYLDNILYINEQPYTEAFITEIETKNFLFVDICSIEDCPEGVIPKDKYLVLGDNRPESVDSRTPEFGLRDKSDIQGEVALKIWPFSEFGRIK